MILYSIIIPFYNSASTIRRLIDSIPDCPFVEIIIVDDCSDSEESMRLRKIISQLNKQILLLKSKINLGAGHARNLALELAQGKWLVFADSDDYFTPQFSEVLHKYENSREQIIYFNAISIMEPDGGYSHRHSQIEKWIKEKNEDDLRFAFHGPVCKLVKASLVKENNICFFESHAFNDALFSAKIGYYAQNIVIDQTPIYCITETPYSTTYTLSETILKSRIDAIKAVNSFFCSVGIKEYDMPIFPHLIYARKLGFKGFIKIFCQIIKMHINPFKGITEYFK